MKTRFAARCLLLGGLSLLGVGGGLTGLAAAGCAPPPPAPPAPPVATASVPVVARPPTLSVQTSYLLDGLLLGLKLDNVPVEGEVRLVDAERLDALVSPGDPISPEDAAQGRLLRLTKGEVLLSPEQLKSWASAREMEWVVQGRRYPYPQSPGAWAFGCELSLIELSHLEPGTQPVPGPELFPPHCDAAGQAAWTLQRDQLTAAQEGLWRSLDDRTLTQLPLIQDPTLRQTACARAIQSGAEQASVEVGIRLVTGCEAHLPPALLHRWLIPERMATISAAFERARAEKVEQQYQFYLRYRVTKDPRVTELRKLAARNFGPKNPARFLAAARALESLNSHERFVRLCSFDENRVRIAYRFMGGYGSLVPEKAERFARAAECETSGESARVGCGMPGPMLLDRMVMRRPDAQRPRVQQMALQLTGTKQIEWDYSCPPTDRWYLIPPETERFKQIGED